MSFLCKICSTKFTFHNEDFAKISQIIQQFPLNLGGAVIIVLGYKPKHPRLEEWRRPKQMLS